MNNDDGLERLSRVRASLEGSLRRLSRGASVALPRREGETRSRRALPGVGGPFGTGTSPITGASPEVLTVNVTLSGETIFLDDERRTRALAKEIRRLITEDRRRGLGVGG